MQGFNRVSTLNSALTFNLKNKDWQQEALERFELKIKAKSAQSPGWFRITIVALNQAALTMLSEDACFWLHQNHNTINANLINESPKKCALVFLRHNPLNSITLHWHRIPQHGDRPEFSIKIKQISYASAWFFMLTQVSRQQAALGGKRSYIYRISRARTKRSGLEVALDKLVKEYQPQLSYQLISCEPYSYWRQHLEQSYLQQQLCLPKAPDINFYITVRFKQDEAALSATLQSILQQNHPNWQVNITQTTASHNEYTKHLISQDSRFSADNLKHLNENDWCIFIEAGDTLAANCLPILARHINQQACDIIYTDHDLTDDRGLRVAPRFKPQWSPDFIMHQNYIGNAYAVKGALLKTVVTQPKWWLLHHYLILLLAIANIKVSNRATMIKHLPSVLFHQAKFNQKLGYSKKTITQITQCLKEIAKQSNEEIIKVTKGNGDTIFHVHYAIPRPLPLVSIIVPTRDALQITRTCINSILFQTSYPNYEIIIVDNQSEQPETLEWFKTLKNHPKIRILRYDQPFNYSAINNYAVKHAKGSLVCLLNNDTEIINKTWLTEMLQHACRQSIGCVGAKLYYYDNSVQHAGVVLGLWGLAGHAHKNFLKFQKGQLARLVSVNNVSAVTAACLLIKKSLFEQVGGLDETHLTVAFNDVDFCLKVQQAGFQNLWTPYAELYHYESKSRGKEDTPEKKAREKREVAYMQRKWKLVIDNDPYYHPYLTRTREDFTLSIV